MKQLRGFILCLQIMLFLTLPEMVYATVIITEIHPNPSAGQEWVELFNPTDSDIDITGWWLEDQLTTPSTIYTAGTQILLPHQTKLITLLSAKLNNSADGVVLKQANGEIIDSFSYTSSEPGLSWSRQSNNPNDFILSTASPGEYTPPALPSPTPSPSPNPLPSPSPTPSPSPNYPLNLQPSEIVACPVEGETEWLEISNPNAQAYSLENWKVRDSSGTTRTFGSTIISSHSFKTFSWSGSLLNNTGDSITLEAPTGTVLFTAEFGACQAGRSFILHDQTWRETLTPTPNQANTYHNPSPSPSATPNPVPSPTPSTTPSPLASISSTLITPSSSTQFSPPTTSQKSSLNFDPATINLTSPSSPALLDQPPTISMATPLNIPKWPVISVILGGVLLSSGSTYYLYEYFNRYPSHAHQLDPPFDQLV